MTKHGLAAWVEVDLTALEENFHKLSALGSAKIAPVVKADAYGHGAIEVGRRVVAAGARLLIVARLQEAIALRDAGIEARILVLAPPDAEAWPLLVQHRLEIICSTPASLAFLLQAESAEPLPVHVKFNTGMNRLGLPPGDAAEILARLDRATGVRPVTICSHLADADLPDSDRTEEQVARFQSLRDSLPSPLDRLKTHLGNSAGLLHHELGDHSLVRLGLALYGYDPTDVGASLEPVMSVHARVLQVHDLAPGERVGYGGLWMAPEPARVATVGVGYGDGYARHQTGNPRVLTEDGPRPLAGSVSMDLLSFALAPGDTTAAGDRVTLLGARGGERIDAHELAANAETIAYEILVRFGQRLPVVVVKW